MNALWLHVVGVLTLVLMLTFIGIWTWAWHPRHRVAFGRLSRIPMADGGGEGPPAREARP